MANIPSVNYSNASAIQTVTPVTPALTGNTVEYKSNKRQTLYARNGSASSVTLTLKSANAPAAFQCDGTGMTEDLTAGAALTVAAGATRAVPLLAYRAYLQGAVTLDASAVTDVSLWLVED